MIEALRSEWEAQQALQGLAAAVAEVGAALGPPAAGGSRASDEIQARAAAIHARAMGRR